MAEHFLGTLNTKPQTDKETGCTSYDPTAFQSCRQAYFLKQQNQILQTKAESPKKEIIPLQETKPPQADIFYKDFTYTVIILTGLVLITLCVVFIFKKLWK